MNWNLEGLKVTGKYLGDYLISGRVELSRVTYGGGITHHVVLDEPITVFNALRDRVILDHKEVLQVSSN